MKSKISKTIQTKGPGIVILDDGIRTTDRIRAGRRCICSPRMWDLGNDDAGCGCGCYNYPADVNGTANCNLAN